MKAKRSKNVDRISSLPESLIHYILSFLPTKDVVATSILSKRWKFMWTNITSLELCDGDHSSTNNFVHSVNRVLLLLDARLSLQRFRLQWSAPQQDYVSTWVTFAVCRNVRHIQASVDPRRHFIHTPPALFTSPTLEHLNLRGSFMLKLPSFCSLPSLRILCLDEIAYHSPDCVSRIISASPVLHSAEIATDIPYTNLAFRISSESLTCLKIYRYEEDVLGENVDRKLEIDAPSLERLLLFDHIANEFSLARPWSLKSVNITLGWISDDHESDLMDGVFEVQCNSALKLVTALRNVEFLAMEHAVLRTLSHATATAPSSACFDRLTTLYVLVECCHWSYLPVMLSHYVKLQVLKVSMDPRSHHPHHTKCWNRPQGGVPQCLSSSLAQVSYAGFRCRKDETAMIKYFLKHGAVLKSIDLRCYARPCYFNKIRSSYKVQRILEFPRLSVDCAIKFDGDHIGANCFGNCWLTEISKLSL